MMYMYDVAHVGTYGYADIILILPTIYTHELFFICYCSTLDGFAIV